MNQEFLTIDGRQVAINGERNLLELARKVGIDIPSFCYHSELSVYGACRLCLVDIEGRGVVGSCSTAPMAGMVVRTATAEIREMRKITIELLLADHHQGCTTCGKSADCKLLDLARRLGVDKVRFKPAKEPVALDDSNPSLVRDPNKCILCGDCVRVCSEVQGIGAIDFAHRGANSCVVPAFGKDLGQVECVFCGQCARVCPTGAIVPKSAVEDVFAELAKPEKTVVVQIAPAVRVAVGEAFGLEPGTDVTGRIVAALKMMGFDQVYDTCFAADLTVLEEAAEFIQRKQAGENLPQFTSCCPGWVKYAEQYHPDLLPNLSSCRSPQAMFGSLAKDILPAKLGVDKDNLTIVSIMPCTAKKYEAQREELGKDGIPDVDLVLTSQELVRMIESTGLDFASLEPAALDLPLGFKTGAGVIFGNSGGVSEAVLRHAYEVLTGKSLQNVEFSEVRGEEGFREATVTLGDISLKLAVVHSLANAKRICRQIEAGECDYDLIEVMACPGGCVGGAGQPVSFNPEARRKRTAGLYAVDRRLQVHKSLDNPYLERTYQEHLGEVGGHRAHELLHTTYQSRKRIADEEVSLLGGTKSPVNVTVCVGTSCFLRGSQDLLKALLAYVERRQLAGQVNVKATFCHERCDRGPTVGINSTFIEKCTLERAVGAVEAALRGEEPAAASGHSCSSCGGCKA
jgi:NADH-quinone oxidoreductase subunit G